jgi:hypothetical protein
MSADPQARPWMPRIQQLPKLGTVGVLKPCCRIRRISINPARFTSCDHAPGGCFPGLRSLTLPAPGSSVLSATPCPEGHSMASFTTTPLTDHTGVEVIGAKRP